MSPIKRIEFFRSITTFKSAYFKYEMILGFSRSFCISYFYKKKQKKMSIQNSRSCGGRGGVSFFHISLLLSPSTGCRHNAKLIIVGGDYRTSKIRKIDKMALGLRAAGGGKWQVWTKYFGFCDKRFCDKKVKIKNLKIRLPQSHCGDYNGKGAKIRFFFFLLVFLFGAI